MLHIIIVHNPIIFQDIYKQIGAKKIPLENLSYEVYSHGNIRIIGKLDLSLENLLTSITTEFNPDTIFLLSESYPVSDEKLLGDIILPNVFFQYNTEIDTMNIEKEAADSLLSLPIFLEHYNLQGDYNFESFGLSIGGIHVSGHWNETIEDFRIRLRVVYEPDTFDSELYHFVQVAKNQWLQEKIYPVAYIATQDVLQDSKNLWSITGFIIGSIDPDLISEQVDTSEAYGEEDETWVDGSEEEK